MRKIWFDPSTAIMAGLQIFSALSSFNQADTQRTVYASQGQMYRDQADAVKIDEYYAREDLGIQRDRALATSKAISVAQGGGLDEGILPAQAAQYGAQDERLRQKSFLQQRALYARANYADMIGAAEQSAGRGKGASGLLQGGYNLFKAFTMGGGGGKGGSAGASAQSALPSLGGILS